MRRFAGKSFTGSGRVILAAEIAPDEEQAGLVAVEKFITADVPGVGALVNGEVFGVGLRIDRLGIVV